MPNWKKLTTICCYFFYSFSGLTLAPIAFSADTLNKSINEAQKMHQQGAKSQTRILKSKDVTQQLLAQFQTLNHELDQLKINQAHLLQTQSQQVLSINSLQKQLSEVETTEKAIIPHLLTMIDWLDSFIAKDIPFHTETRQHSLAYLKASMIDPDTSLPERYRRVLEAYQIESEYGYTIEAYPQTIKVNNQNLHVNLLRVGRVGLYYQSADGQRSGYWDHKQDQWQVALEGIDDEIKQGLLIAQKQRPHTLLTLPVTR